MGSRHKESDLKGTNCRSQSRGGVGRARGKGWRRDKRDCDLSTLIAVSLKAILCPAAFLDLCQYFTTPQLTRHLDSCSVIHAVSLHFARPSVSPI